MTKILLALVIGALAGAAAIWLAVDGTTNQAHSVRAPLYWVAPMDPSYKRDKPGKSPMGMDLIPVYEQDAGDNAEGVVLISPDVVQNLGVRTAVVTRGRLAISVNTVGYVQYDEDRLIHIHPRVEGWIEKLYVKAAGDPVKQGEPLYAFYSPTLVNAQEELLLAMKRQNPVLIEAAMARLSALQVPQSEIRRLKNTGEVNQTITITAPQSGVVDDLNAREGMYVKPGMEVMSIGMLEHIWVIGEVFERQATAVHAGDAVQLRLDYLPGREWSGKVDYIYPSLNPKTRTGRVRVHFNNPDRFLKPGMFAQMTIETPSMEQVLLIPREALIRTGNQSRVVLAQDGERFKSIAVAVGRVAEDQVEIIDGLREGDRIVTSAQFLIDSESSKTSDFKRLNHDDDLNADTSANTVADVGSHEAADHLATVGGVVNHVDLERRLINISRGAVEKWNRPAATLDFVAGANLDLHGLSPGDPIQFTFTVDQGVFTVTDLQLLGSARHGSGVDADAGMKEGSHD